MRFEDIFDLKENESRESSKVISLKNAILQSITPGITIHSNTGAYPNAALREIIRCFLDKKPDFTFVSSGITTPYEICLVCSGLVKKVITTNHSYTFPTPKPIKVLQQKQKGGLISIESWSTYTLEQRLMAAALGTEFMPTKSLMGSNLVQHNENFKVVSNPFGKNPVGVVRALYPDISIIHGCVADEFGNTILAPPYFTSIWGAKASKEGAIVTVERIVSTNFIRKHASLVKIPGQFVKFVCEVPFGSHPQGLAAESIGVVEGYGEDYDFLNEFVSLTQREEELKQWIEEWILSLQNHDDYLRKLGVKRLTYLKGKSNSDIWKLEKITLKKDLCTFEDFNRIEMMIIVGARKIAKIVEKNSYNSILAGIGTSALSAWVAYYILKRRKKREIVLLSGLGHVGYAPRPGDPYLMALSNVTSSRMLADTIEIYGSLVGGANSKCISVIGTAQIDKYGNTNTVKLKNKIFIGVGGSADALNAKETLVVAKQSRDRFLEEVPFIGCVGSKVKTLVTDFGVFEKLDGEKTFTLTGYIKVPNVEREEQIEEIRKHCGWQLKIADKLEEIPPPTKEELYILKTLDPKGRFRGKKKAEKR